MSSPYGGWDDRSAGYGRPAAPPPTSGAPPAYPQQLPPYSQQLPPYSQQLPPCSQQLPPCSQQAPPYSQQAPPYSQQLPPPAPAGAHRPAVIATSTTLAITGALLFGCGLGFLWLVAFSVRTEFDPGADDQTVLFHIAERFHLRMTQGLAVPLFGFPLAAVVAAFLVPAGRRWGRLVLTAVGVAALAWSGWWLRARLGWWVPGAVYIGVTCAILWLPGVSRWYALVDPARARPKPHRG